jgi:thioredoxin 1
MSEHVKTITDSSFDAEVMAAPVPVLVDFWAEWCGPCKALAPILNDVAEDYRESVSVCKINADENKAAMQKHSVRGLPTLILFVGGEEKGRILGITSKTRIAALLDQQLGG